MRKILYFYWNIPIGVSTRSRESCGMRKILYFYFNIPIGVPTRSWHSVSFSSSEMYGLVMQCDQLGIKGWYLPLLEVADTSRCCFANTGPEGGGVSGSAGRSHQALFTGLRGRWACLFTVFPEGKSSLSQGKRGNLVVISDPANRKLWPNVGSMLGQRRRRRLNIEPTMGQCLIFVGKWRDGKLGQCWPNSVNAGPSSHQSFYLMWAALAAPANTTRWSNAG